jgi:hypothetical protein
MQLIFVYNADSGILNLLKDAAHKMLRPQTYPCSLCALTYGAVSEKRRWREFRENDDRNMRFLHKDEFEAEFNQRFDYPLILEQNSPPGEAGNLSVVFDSQALNELQDVDSLIHGLLSTSSSTSASAASARSSCGLSRQ